MPIALFLAIIVIIPVCYGIFFVDIQKSTKLIWPAIWVPLLIWVIFVGLHEKKYQRIEVIKLQTIEVKPSNNSPGYKKQIILDKDGDEHNITKIKHCYYDEENTMVTMKVPNRYVYGLLMNYKIEYIMGMVPKEQEKQEQIKEDIQ